jgi:hypothetical protein
VTLTEFLLARIAEDEAVARVCARVYPSPWEMSDRGYMAYVKADEPDFREVARLEQEHVERGSVAWLGEALDHIARHDPARVLAECEAKRRIVRALTAREAPDFESDDPRDVGATFAFRESCLALAAPYADHPDYDRAWRL